MAESTKNKTRVVGGVGKKASNGGTQYYQQDRVYIMGDVALALPAQIPGGSYNYMEIKVIGRMDHTVDHTLESANRVYDRGGCCPTITTGTGGGIMPKVIDVCCVSSRGRDKTNPNHKGKANENYEQRLEPRMDGCTGTITTVQKDNMVLIRQATKQGYIPCKVGGVADLSYPSSKTRRGRVIDMGMTSPTLTTGSIPEVLEDWVWEVDGVKYKIRIRKLTPRECFRLMDFTDEDFSKAEEVNSNTQLYKQAGNSIVKSCLCHIFKELIEQ